MAVSIIVPTYQRPDKLGMAIQSALAQRDVGQVVVIIDGDASRYDSLRADYRGHAKVQIVATGRRLRSAGARNAGIERATGDYLLFLDDDIVLDESFVSRALQTMAERDADGVGGSVLLPDRGHRDRPFFSPRTLLVYADSGRGPIEVPFTTTITLWRRWVFDRGVRFPYYPANGYREESDLCIQALRRGAKIIYDPRCVSRHHHRDYGGGQWAKGAVWWYLYSLRNNWVFLRRHYSFLRERFGYRRPAAVVWLSTALRNGTLFVPARIKAFIQRAGLVGT